MKYIMDSIQAEGINAKTCFWDGCVLVGNPAATERAAELTADLRSKTGLESKWG